MRSTYCILLTLVILSCQKGNNAGLMNEETNVLSQEKNPVDKITTIHDTSFVNLKTISDGFSFDMKYATNNNFLNKKVYPCDNCLLRYQVAKALIEANFILDKIGFRLKLYDCFRPVSVQHQMWKILPDSKYVANPHKNGSSHNRGAAVDLTIVDFNDKELDMGTEFDYFGEEAHHQFKNLADTIIQNRLLLKQTMQNVGFQAISTEWWHYLLGEKTDFSISSHPLCE